MLLCTCSSVLTFCESFITVVIGRLMRKCWHHISLFTVTSHLAQWFVNRLCSFSLEIVRGRQSDFDFFFYLGRGHSPLPRPHPCYWTFWHFFQKPILNNHSVMCHCKCIIAQVQSAWMPPCLWAWENFQWKVMKWQWSVRATREIQWQV